MKMFPDFNGKLRFQEKLNKKKVDALYSLLNVNWQKHPEWGAPAGVQIMPLDIPLDRSGFVYASYIRNPDEDVDMVETVNALIRQMKQRNLDFGLKGSLIARSRFGKPCWELYIGEDGFAHKRDLKTLECPHCGGDLLIEGIREI
jgi:hypothetical protein